MMMVMMMTIMLMFIIIFLITIILHTVLLLRFIVIVYMGICDPACAGLKIVALDFLSKLRPTNLIQWQ